MDFKEVIANAVSKVTNIDKDEIKGFIEIPKEEANGDYSFPCFRLAKELHQSPINIANNIKENIDIDQNVISRIDVVNGYLNFYINKKEIVKEAIEKFDAQKEKYGMSDMGKGKDIQYRSFENNYNRKFFI